MSKMILTDDGTLGYYTIFIPAAPDGDRTEWHPYRGDGPQVLTRGAFPTERAAIAWGRAHLNGTPYTVVFVPAEDAESEHECEEAN